MTVGQLLLELRKHDSRAKVELVIARGDERIYTEAASVDIAKDYRGRITVEITNEE